MKRILTLLILGAATLLMVSCAYAVTTVNIPVTATIGAGTPDMTVAVYKAPNGDWRLINWAAPVTSMAFSKFDVVTRGTQPAQWTSIDLFVAFVYASGLGRQYKITSTGTGALTRTGGTETFPAGSFACTPVYRGGDDGDYWLLPDGTKVYQSVDRPTGSSLGTIGRAITTSKLVYQSENPGSARIIQSWYSFPPYTSTGTAPYTLYAPIPSTQVAGTYTGLTVTIDIVPM